MTQELALLVTDSFVEECKALLVEGEFNSRWELIKTYHELGSLILEHTDNNPVTEFTATLAGKLKKSERLLWYAIKFSKMFPTLNDLPEGKNTNWNKVMQKYLTAKTPECLHNGEKKEIKIVLCADCDKRLN